jgi:hypothetical protein
MWAQGGRGGYSPATGGTSGGGGGAVASVFGRIGIVGATSGDYNTALVTESGSLYFTNARAVAAMAGLYQLPITGAPGTWPTFTAFATLATGASTKVVLGNGTLATLDTSITPENTNLYFTNARAVAAMAGLYQAPISGAPGTWPTFATVATSGSASDLGTGILPAARLPVPSASTLGGVQSKDCSSGGQFVQKINTDGTESCATAAGTITFAQGAFASLPSCTSVLNEVYYFTDSTYRQGNCLTGASAWTYFLADGIVGTPPVAASNWSVVNGASGTATLADSAGNVVLSTASDVLGLEVAVKAVKTPPYTETMAVRWQAFTNVSAGGFAQINCGPVWTATAATSSAAEISGPWLSTSSSGVANIAQLAYRTIDLTNFTGTTSSGKDFGMNFINPSATLWYQMIDDNTNRTIKLSVDGKKFVTVYGPTSRTSPFTAGFIGIACLPLDGGVSTPWSITLLSDN